jgi:hypothetical protein
MAQDPHKAELIATLARSRAEITNDFRKVRHDLDFASRARRAFARHPAVWVGAAVLLGLFISRLPLRRKKAPAPSRRKSEPAVEKVEKAGLLFGALKFAFDIVRPTLMGWATRRVAEHFERGNRGGGYGS